RSPAPGSSRMLSPSRLRARVLPGTGVEALGLPPSGYLGLCRAEGNTPRISANASPLIDSLSLRHVGSNFSSPAPQTARFLEPVGNDFCRVAPQMARFLELPSAPSWPTAQELVPERRFLSRSPSPIRATSRVHDAGTWPLASAWTSAAPTSCPGLHHVGHPALVLHAAPATSSFAFGTPAFGGVPSGPFLFVAVPAAPVVSGASGASSFSAAHYPFACSAASVVPSACAAAFVAAPSVCAAPVLPEGSAVCSAIPSDPHPCAPASAAATSVCPILAVGGSAVKQRIAELEEELARTKLELEQAEVRLGDRISTGPGLAESPLDKAVQPSSVPSERAVLEEKIRSRVHGELRQLELQEAAGVGEAPLRSECGAAAEHSDKASQASKLTASKSPPERAGGKPSSLPSALMGLVQAWGGEVSGSSRA
ncbi:unnamed protein product, partial [Polarella glacialis]